MNEINLTGGEKGYVTRITNALIESPRLLKFHIQTGIFPRLKYGSVDIK